MVNLILVLLFFLAGLFFGVRGSISYINAYDAILLPYYKTIISIYIISLYCFIFTFCGIIIHIIFAKYFRSLSNPGKETRPVAIKKIPLFLMLLCLIVFVLSVILINQGMSFHKDSNIDPKTTKVFLIGLDGATWNVLIPLVEKGELPAFRELLNQSYWGQLRCAERATSPLVWTSIATGKVAEKHGVFDHTVREPGTYESVPVKSYHRKVKAIWNILSENKKTVGLIDWYVTFPPEKVNGYVISRLTADEKDKTYPSEIQKDIDEMNKKFITQKTEDNLFHVKEELLNDVRKLSAATSYMRGKTPTDFLGVYTHSTDAVQHYFWKYMEPQKYDYKIWGMNDSDVKKYGEVIEYHYIEVDKMIGDLTKNIDDNTMLIILSDHGAQAQTFPHVAVDVDKILDITGFLSFKNNFQEIDFSEAKAFSAGIEKNYQIKGVCLNLKGRETTGIVNPGEDEERIKSEIMKALADLKILENGENIFSKVISGKDMKEKRWEDSKIDLFAYSNDEALKEFYKTHIKIAGETFPLTDILSIDDTSGEHANEGIILMSGKNIKSKFIFPALDIKIARVLKKTAKTIFGDNTPLLVKKCFFILNFESIAPTTLDITPTILYSMGLPVGKDMDGKTIIDAFKSSFISKNPLNYINTYEGPLSTKSNKVTSTADENMLKKLKALGYIQ
ncbi:MAG: alkaline phosphatase family protein [Candidatus Schekmanbacteria bacterium]|nr:alkaline phosphatase family protein [Candidatus Schekmanbacteria bacterium]